METPLVRPGLVRSEPVSTRLVAFFPFSAHGNLAIQRLLVLGVPSDQLGVTTPDRMPNPGQGLLLSVPCETPEQGSEVEAICRALGATVHRQNA